MRRCWTDLASFRGRCVPRYVLKAAYEAAGETLAFSVGGRGMRLGKDEEAWKVLNEWRESVGDETDAEDRFVLDGTEDDDLLDDDEL